MNYPTFQKVIDDLDKSYKANQGFANRWNPYDLGKFTITWEDAGLSYEGTIQICTKLSLKD